MTKSDALPFETTLYVRDNCLCLHVQRAARALARHYDEALRPVGLTHGQFSLMMSLNRPGGARRMGEVSNTLALDRTTLTANLKPLQRRGLVTVTVDDNDKRSRCMALTPAGRALLVTAFPIWKRAKAESEKHLSAADNERLRAVLRSLSGTPDKPAQTVAPTPARRRAAK
jgi:DNA-binding MarR family transcriptional regulator